MVEWIQWLTYIPCVAVLVFFRDRSLFMEGGEGNFHILKEGYFHI